MRTKRFFTPRAVHWQMADKSPRYLRPTAAALSKVRAVTPRGTTRSTGLGARQGSASPRAHDLRDTLSQPAGVEYETAPPPPNDLLPCCSWLPHAAKVPPCRSDSLNFFSQIRGGARQKCCSPRTQADNELERRCSEWRDEQQVGAQHFSTADQDPALCAQQNVSRRSPLSTRDSEK